ncbi:hypothetical protein MMC13_008100 [Lambiella insularis]|nr:hypothetical protein [Lambiella insularis]
MRLSTLALFLLPSLISASSSPSLPPAASPSSPAILSPPTATPQSPPPAPQSPNPFFPPKLAYPVALFEFIANLQTPIGAVKQRQAGVALGGGAGAAPTPTEQVSPVTTIFQNGTPVPYTQTFAAVPDQGPSAMSGSIGMGTLTGAVGVVRTDEAKNEGNGIRLSWTSGVCAGVVICFVGVL